ncbi:MAG TPA: hypothetical protein VGM78_05860 [Ilumatobacteraceae bacterium]|jgi:hypothetical protein
MIGSFRYVDPAPDETPRIAASVIVDRFATDGSASTDPGTAHLTDISFGYYHDPVNDEPGRPAPLVYLLHVAQDACEPSMPSPLPGSPNPSIVALPCGAALIVDASTAELIISIGE